MAQRKKWVIRADTPNVPHRLLSTTTFLFLRDLKCWHKTSFFSNHSDNGLQLFRSFFCFCGDFSFSFFPHCILKIKKFQVTDKKSVQAEARVLRKTFFVFSPKISHRSTPKCPPPPQPPPPSCPSSPPLSSFGGIWSGSCHRIGTGRSGKASPVLRLHLVGFPGPGDPRLRQTSASFLAKRWEERKDKIKTVKTDTWQYNLQFLIIIKRILYMCFY